MGFGLLFRQTLYQPHFQRLILACDQALAGGLYPAAAGPLGVNVLFIVGRACWRLPLPTGCCVTTRMGLPLARGRGQYRCGACHGAEAPIACRLLATGAGGAFGWRRRCLPVRSIMPGSLDEGISSAQGLHGHCAGNFWLAGTPINCFLGGTAFGGAGGNLPALQSVGIN